MQNDWQLRWFNNKLSYIKEQNISIGNSQRIFWDTRPYVYPVNIALKRTTLQHHLATDWHRTFHLKYSNKISSCLTWSNKIVCFFWRKTSAIEQIRAGRTSPSRCYIRKCSQAHFDRKFTPVLNALIDGRPQMRYISWSAAENSNLLDISMKRSHELYRNMK